MQDNAPALPFPLLRLGRSPKQGVDTVLPNGRHELVTDLEHVEDDVELDHRLRLDEVVHDRDVHYRHHLVTNDKEGYLEDVARLGREHEPGR